MKQEENSLLNIVTKNLAKLAGLKCLDLPKETYKIWYDQIKSDFAAGKINDIQKGFDHLLAEKTFGGLDYAIFLKGAKISDEEQIEKVWQEVLESAKTAGRLSISARSGKALNSMGGMIWLRNSMKDDVNWQKKEFIDAYKNIPEPENLDFRCSGLKAPMYLSGKNIKQLEEKK